MLVAGGTSVGLLVGQRLIAPSVLVWLGRIPGLDEIRVRDGGLLTIGASATLRALATSPVIAREVPALAAAAAAVGNIRVRAVATIGGALAHGDPRQDLPPVLLALDAHVTLDGPAGRRQVQVRDLFTGFLETVAAPDEVLTEVSIPLVAGRRSAYCRFTPASAADYPTVGVAATVTAGLDGSITAATVALGAAGPTAIRVPEAADALDALPRRTSTELTAAIDAVAEAASSRADPTSDRQGSAAYKRAMVKVWTRRALAACLD